MVYRTLYFVPQYISYHYTMSTASPPALSPPAAKRIKLDTEGAPLSSPLKSQQDPSELPPATSAPEILSASTFTPPVDEDISDEEGLEDVKEEEDLTRRDMYLDTVSPYRVSFDVKLIEPFRSRGSPLILTLKSCAPRA